MATTNAGTLRLGTAQGRWVLLATVLGSSMAMLDGTVVNVALPRIGTDLGASLASLQWTLNAYLLTLAGLILLGGALGDRYGRRRVFLLGVVWFAVASAACAAAPNIQVLIAARAVQGIGGALLTPGSLAMLQAVFHPDDRSAAVGLWSGLGGVSAAVGPFLGGWLVDGPGWRWIFLLNLPLAAAVIAVATRHVPESRDESATGRFDVLGSVLAALALGAITYALTAAGEGLSPAVWVTGVLGLVLCAAFIAVERRAPEPMLPLGLFSSRLFTAVNLVTLCVYAAFSGVFFLLVVQLQIVAHFSPLVSGLALVPITVLMLALSSRAARLGKRIGPRIPLTVGPLLCAAGVLLMLRIGAGSSYWADVLPAVTVMGSGMTLLVAPLTATVLAAVEVRHAGIASGVNNAAARAAGLLAVAALPALAGLSGEAYRVPSAVDDAFHTAMLICAGLLTTGAITAFVTIRGNVLAPEDHPVAEPDTEWCCGTTPPLDPGHVHTPEGPATDPAAGPSRS
ncbi:DHA2 family efflux MFS transporter permease subunit [Streptomyces sp. SP17BM10]|uniref:DHA2 family efflux MFS transporter permease subunit n=1 Tax=Streptomyces sp. SP17BM10 TaxID=3002530 RepID=UPI002E7783FC|nr:DHA2 family efflux MFS transporter permease subunit [Streptomyces sp. SP17BM10]MEE1782007.1 DHA2 family efflux MFS transporter permease subunit [Streptomyces sp. SP17BM10]